MEIELAEKTLGELTLFIGHLIDTNMEGLIQLLYRIDVSEKEILKITIHHAIDAESLALIIYRRIQQKKAQKAYWTEYFHGKDIDPV
jgi:ACT domain-containing protein